MKYSPYEYQEKGEQHIVENPYSALFMEMGLGKTVITLTAIDWLMNKDPGWYAIEKLCHDRAP